MISDLKEKLATIERPERTASIEYRRCYSLAVEMYHEIIAIRKIAEAVFMSAESEINSDDWMHWHSESYKLAKKWRGGSDDS